MAEHDLQTACLKAIKGRKDIWAINIVGSATQKGGTPDLLMSVRGRFVAAELKQPGASPKPHEGRQRVQMRLITRTGAAGAVVRSVDEFLALIDSV